MESCGGKSGFYVEEGNRRFGFALGMACHVRWRLAQRNMVLAAWELTVGMRPRAIVLQLPWRRCGDL